MPAVAGSCFGYAVHTPLAFRFLRPGGGEPVRVYEHDGAALPSPGAETWAEWPPDDLRPTTITLYRAGGRCELRMGDSWFVIDPAEPSIGIPAGADPIVREEVAWGLPLMLCFLERGDVPLHAAVVDVGGRAIAMGAHTHSGKTTLATAFWRAGHRVLTEDLACIRLDPAPAVVPGPALLRLRPDMAARLGIAPMPGVVDGADRCRVVLRDEGDPTRPVPLGAIVLIQGEADAVEIERIDPVAAIPQILALRFTLPPPFDAARSFEGVADLAGHVPVLGLRRPLTVEALPDVVAALAAHV